MGELKAMNDAVIAPKGGPEAETPAALSERLGDLHWKLLLDKVQELPGGMVDVQFHMPSLPKPVTMQIALGPAEPLPKWAALKSGATADVTARVTIDAPNKISVKVKLASM
jgi:hypothetical protein